MDEGVRVASPAVGEKLRRSTLTVHLQHLLRICLGRFHSCMVLVHWLSRVMQYGRRLHAALL